MKRVKSAKRGSFSNKRLEKVLRIGETVRKIAWKPWKDDSSPTDNDGSPILAEKEYVSIYGNIEANISKEVNKEPEANKEPFCLKDIFISAPVQRKEVNNNSSMGETTENLNKPLMRLQKFAPKGMKYS